MVSVDLPKSVSDVSDLSLVRANSAAKPIDVQLDKVAGASFARPTIGFLAPVGRNGDALAEAMVISPGVLMTEQGSTGPCKDSWTSEYRPEKLSGGAGRNSLILVSPGGPARSLDFRLSGFGRGAQFPLQVDFGNNSFRLSSIIRSGGLPESLCLLAFQAAAQSDGASPGPQGRNRLGSCL